MSRIADQFAACKVNGRTALIPFITAGDPAPNLLRPCLDFLVTAGADLIEIGMPFSDPSADGPVIQKANERALLKGMGLPTILAAVTGFRLNNQRTPIILMGYLNPIEQYGFEKFCKDASHSGVDGLLLVDLPPEESAPFKAIFQARGLAQIFLVAPTTSKIRREKILSMVEGFVYFVSFKGITGANQLDLEPIREPLRELREASPVPVAVGFGIKDAQTAVAMAAHADAVVVGSALVQALSEATDEHSARGIIDTVLGPIRAALDEQATSKKMS
jgi:tryptophan synthase alpha chain